MPLAKKIVELGMIIEEPASGYVGEVMKIQRVAGRWQMILEDAARNQRAFELGLGYWIEGEPVELLAPPPPKAKAQRTASGSVHVSHRAKVAKASRIWVEGKHDAELVSKIWGADLAYSAIMIEELFGADNLEAILADFAPSDTKRAGVLLDHLVPGSKETAIAEKLTGPGILILGHPYVDIWQAIKPEVIGIKRWPEVPLGEDFKRGTLARLGWPHESAADVGIAWQRILSQVTDYRQLEPAFLARMEELIDFVTAV